MSVAAALVEKLRRMVNEPGTTTYSDLVLADYIAAWPVQDVHGFDPTADGWTATFDLHAAAMEIWEEKAGVISMKFDFSADGGSYSRNQEYQAAMGQARWHAARRKASSRAVQKVAVAGSGTVSV